VISKAARSRKTKARPRTMVAPTLLKRLSKDSASRPPIRPPLPAAPDMVPER
jgi:hypothetical protein